MRFFVRIGVLNNLRAKRSSTQISQVVSFLQGYPDVPHIETDNGDGVPEALALLANQGVGVKFTEQQFDDLLASGGYSEPADRYRLKLEAMVLGILP